MEGILQALFQQYMNPRQVEVDEMGMSQDGGMNAMAQALMSGSTDVPLVGAGGAFKVQSTFGGGKKGKQDSTTLAPSYGPR